MAELTVVYTDPSGTFSWVHLDADGRPWIHGTAVATAEEAFNNAALAFPAWRTSAIAYNPWTA